MLLHKPILFLGLLVVMCFAVAEVAIAQFGGQRLIPLSDVSEVHPAQDFVVYGRACKGRPPITDPAAACGAYTGEGAYNAGILASVTYRYIPNSRGTEETDLERMPDLETFFDFGGTLELLTTDLTLNTYDLVISELMWGIDRGLDDTEGTVRIPNPNYDPNVAVGQNNPDTIEVTVPIIQNQETQWIELYNTTGSDITAVLYFLFTPLNPQPIRADNTVEIDGTSYRVLDAIDTLFNGLWKLPGKSGRRPTTALVSAYRNINYATVEDTDLARQTQLSGIPPGSNPDSWERTPESGRRNTELRILAGGELIQLPCIATPGTKHVGGAFIGRLDSVPVRSNLIVINEVRNDTSRDNVDWVELKNMSRQSVQLDDWELSIVTGVGADKDLVDLPDFTLHPNEILLLLNESPHLTHLMNGIDIEVSGRQTPGARHLYFIDTRLNLPNTGKFVLLLRNQTDQNGKDVAIQDYAGNGFFRDNSPYISTGFWPRIGQPVPTHIADFGNNTFADHRNAWVRIRYRKDDGHHEDAWKKVGPQGGLGYAPSAKRSISPGTPGYENDALKTRPAGGNVRTSSTTVSLTDGTLSISEIMYDAGPRGNLAQWIEVYNSSETQAVNLKGWVLDIYNIHDEETRYVDAALTFNEMFILPNQTLLLVSDRRLSKGIPPNRIYDLYRKHGETLGLERPKSLLLSPTGFYMRLVYKTSGGNRIVVDEAGNMSRAGRRQEARWNLPETDPQQRRSIIRQYGDRFRPAAGNRYGSPEPPLDGTAEESWHLASDRTGRWTYYGHKDDRGTPADRLGSPLPVTLSSFRPERTEAGTVKIRWTTQSERNNAGFNILRSEQRSGTFIVINPRLIQGKGTTSERHDYTFTDTTAQPNTVYYYQIQDVSFDGVYQTSVVLRLRGTISIFDKHITTLGDLKGQH